MEISASLQDYLEAILSLKNKKKNVRGTDIALLLNVKKQSVIDAVKLLKEKGLVIQERYSFIELTAKGKSIAEKVMMRHNLIKNFLKTSLGLNEATADEDACKIEHYLSLETIDLIKKYLDNNSVSKS
ncbi:MAG: metal-dependent transcriptional regulator [bacterium]|nr:metal-dependent transcriptional regulator [bacterium]